MAYIVMAYIVMAHIVMARSLRSQVYWSTWRLIDVYALYDAPHEFECTRAPAEYLHGHNYIRP